MQQSQTVLGPGWAVFLFLMLATLPNTFTSTLLAPGLPHLAEFLGGGALGISRSQMLMTIPGVAMLASPLIGWLADRIGPRRVLLTCLALDTAVGLGCLVVRDFWALLALRFLLGLGIGGLMSVSLSMIGEYYVGEGRTRMLGYRWAAMCVFSILAVQLASYLSNHFSWSTPLLLYTIGIPLFIFALVCVRPDEAARKEREAVQKGGAVDAPLRDVVNWTFALAMLGNVFFAIATYNTYAQLPFLLKEQGLPAGTYAQVMIPVTLSSVVMALLFNRVRRHVHPIAIIALSLLVFAAGTLVFASATSSLALFAAAVLIGVGTVVFEPALSSFLLDRIHPSRRAMTMGAIFGTFHLGPFLIPFIFGGINTRYGFSGSFVVLATVAILLGIGMLIGLRGAILSRPMEPAAA